MTTIITDLKYACRQLRKSPGFTAIAITTLALGIGVNLALFGILNEMLLRPKPVKQPQELFAVVPATESGQQSAGLLYRPYFDEIQQSGVLFTDAIAYAHLDPKLKTDQGQEKIPINLVTEGYFEFLGVQPCLGRAFLPEEDKPHTATPVAVISHAFWRGYFNSDPDILGHTMILNDTAIEIVGVTPPGFTGLDFGSPRLWIPANMERVLSSKSALFNDIILRLPNTKLVLTVEDQLSPRVAEVTRKLLDSQYADLSTFGISPQLNQIRLLPIGRGILGTSFKRFKIIRFLQFAAIATLLLLLIACANVAGLFLAQAMKRRKETATRIALGATRLDIMRPIFCEGILVAAGGTLAALGAFTWTSRSIMTLMTFWPGRSLRLLPDLRVLLAALGAVLLVGLGFSLLPALQVSRFNPGEAMKESQGTGRKRRWLRHGLIVAQVTGSLILLSGATLCLRSMAKQLAIDLGYDHERLVFAPIDLERIGFIEETFEPQLQEIVRGIRYQPGIEQVAVSPYQPLVTSNGLSNTFTHVPEGYENGTIANIATYSGIGPGLFEAMGIPLIRGHEFTDEDMTDGRHKLIVNRLFAEQFWPGQDPLGKHIYLGEERVYEWEVVGVLPNVQFILNDDKAYPGIFRVAKKRKLLHSTLVMRTALESDQVASAVQAKLTSIHPKLVNGKMYTIRDVLKQDLAFQHTAVRILACLGGLALVLAAVGTYGVIAYVVNSGTRDIGIRMAIGATRHHVMVQILSMGLRLGLIAAVIGLPLAMGIAIVLRHQIEGISPFDPISFVLVTLSMFAALLLACWLPARRAARIDPMEALRYE